MDVVVDTNVLVADPWWRGEKSRALFNFLERTRSHLLIHEVVDQEFRAVVTRNLNAAAADLEAAARNATRAGLEPAPVDSPALASEARERWERKYADTALARRHVALDNGLLPEVLRRATNRVPPSARKGEEFRDTIMWLGILDYCSANEVRKVAFISANRKDFCGADEKTLAPELVEDAASRGVDVQYFASLDEFLREHAKPLEHFTKEWVLDRISVQDVQSRIEFRMDGSDASEFPLPWQYDRWRSHGYAHIHAVHAELNDVYVWEYSESEATLFLRFYVLVDAEISVEREDPGAWDITVESADIEVQGEYEVEISASVRGDQIELIDIESVDRA